MRKTVAFILMFCVVLSLCGCVNGYETAVTVNEPCDNSVNGYRLERGEEADDYSGGNVVYYANINSKKFHLSTCGTAKRIAEESLYKTNNRNALIADGYTPCKSCNP